MTGVPVTVLRHFKERLSKCSLRALHGRAGITFVKATPGLRFDASGFSVLAVGAPLLTPADAGRPLLLLDSTWRYLAQLRGCLEGEVSERGLPADVRTAYPRVSRVYEDPPGGLASLEALYVAKRLLGEDDPSILEGYHWKDEFLAQFRVRAS